VDIITFYNEVFIPAVKPLLVEVGPGASPKKKEEEKGSADGMRPAQKLCNIVLVLTI
jgi:hypothetical protein